MGVSRSFIYAGAIARLVRVYLNEPGSLCIGCSGFRAAATTAPACRGRRGYIHVGLIGCVHAADTPAGRHRRDCSVLMF